MFCVLIDVPIFCVDVPIFRKAFYSNLSEAYLHTVYPLGEKMYLRGTSGLLVPDNLIYSVVRDD